MLIARCKGTPLSVQLPVVCAAIEPALRIGSARISHPTSLVHQAIGILCNMGARQRESDIPSVQCTQLPTKSTTIERLIGPPGSARAAVQAWCRRGLGENVSDSRDRWKAG